MSATPCLFCRRDATHAVGESHVIPEALGNSARREGDNVLVLAPGHVCDRCNNAFGGGVEANFSSNDIGIIARYRGIPNKKGRYPEFNLPAGSTIAKLGEAPARLKAARISPSDVLPAGQELSAEGTRFTMKVRFRVRHDLTSAFLSKMFIEFLCHQKSRREALHRRWDGHRTNALGLRGSDWLAYYRGASPSPQHSGLKLLYPDLFIFDFDVMRFILPLDVARQVDELPGFVAHTPSGSRGVFLGGDGSVER